MPTTYAIPDGRVAMGVTTYAGTGATNVLTNTVNGVSFQPDFVWIKVRTNAYNHALFDSVRGANKQLASNATDAEVTQTQGLLSFNSNGFTLGTSSDSTVNNAGIGQTYVGWQWKANGAAVTNTAGSITSQVSANTAAGFSVVTYTGTGANATVGHGLGVAPSMIIFKGRFASNWSMYHASIPNATTSILILNSTGAVVGSLPTYWNSTAPSSTVFSLGSDANINGTNAAGLVAYCFAAVPGYSAFGRYTGNGSADGPFVYLGFRPRFVLFRSTSARNWVIRDTSRNTYNAVTNDLYPDSAAAEYAPGDAIDFLSNGFKLRATGATFNGNGEVYIYMAFAENPFAYANAR
jgi:hypothetical protein